MSELLEYLQSLGDSIVSFFSMIGDFMSDLLSGISYIGDFLLDAPSSLQNYLKLLPVDLQGACTIILALVTTLAIVRWIT